MRRLTAAVTMVALLAGGCSTYQSSKTFAKVGGGLVLGGVVTAPIGLALYAKGSGDGGTVAGFGLFVLGWWALLTGVPLGLAGVAGMAMYPSPDEIAAKEKAEARPAPFEGPGGPKARALAREFMKQAAADARAGDCSSSIAHDPKIFELDPEFHAVVFMRDAAIQRCLAASGAPTTP